MKNKGLVYEKKYIFVNGVRIPLAFMDCKELSEEKVAKNKLFQRTKRQQNEATVLLDDNDKTEFIDN